jgi:hypothetical protein
LIAEITERVTAADLDYIAARLPEKTLREFGTEDPRLRAAEAATAAERAFIAYFDDKPAVFMGVTADHFVWVAATKDGQKNKRLFMAVTKEMLARTLSCGRHGYVWAVIPVWYEETVRWCRWLGARFHDKVFDPTLGDSVIITFNLADVAAKRRGKWERAWNG